MLMTKTIMMFLLKVIFHKACNLQKYKKHSLIFTGVKEVNCEVVTYINEAQVSCSDICTIVNNNQLS